MIAQYEEQIIFFLKGLTGIRFAGGEKCYIKSQNKIILPNIMPIKTEEELINLVRMSF